MIKTYFYKHTKAILVAVSILLFLVSYITYVNVDNNPRTSVDFRYFRLLRSISGFVFFIIAFLFQKRIFNSLLISFILLYSLSSYFTIWYEYELIAMLSMGLNTLAFLSIVIYIFPKIKNIKIDLFVIFSFFLIFIILSYLGFQFVASFKGFTLSSLQYFLMVLNVFLIVIITFSSIMYNHKYSSIRSLVFMGFIMFLLFAEVFRGIAYYNLLYGDLMALVARAILVASMALFSYYVILNSKENEEASILLF